MVSLMERFIKITVLEMDPEKVSKPLEYKSNRYSFRFRGTQTDDMRVVCFFRVLMIDRMTHSSCVHSRKHSYMKTNSSPAVTHNNFQVSAA